MPSFSATDRTLAATGNRPVATRASQPSAAAGSLSNCSAINSAARRGTSATDGGVAPCSSWRTGGPIGTSGTPTSASRSAQSGGAHTRTSRAERPQPHRQPHQRFDVPAPPVRRQQHTHVATLSFLKVLALGRPR